MQTGFGFGWKEKQSSREMGITCFPGKWSDLNLVLKPDFGSPHPLKGVWAQYSFKRERKGSSSRHFRNCAKGESAFKEQQKKNLGGFDKRILALQLEKESPSEEADIETDQSTTKERSDALTLWPSHLYPGFTT